MLQTGRIVLRFRLWKLRQERPTNMVTCAELEVENAIAVERERCERLRAALKKVIDWLEFVAKSATEADAKDYRARAKDLRKSLD